MTRIAMGGTFDRFHRGHAVLLETAFRDPEAFVQVGVTSDTLAARARDRVVRPLAERVDAVRRFVADNGWAARGRVVEIDAPEGFALAPEWDTIVVTEETLSGAASINRQRAERGLPALAVRVAPYVLADDGRPLKATRIAAGEVDADGRLTAPVVAVGSENPVKVDAARHAVAVAWPGARVTGVRVDSKVPEQPVGRETWDGALARARAALDAVPDAHLAVGVEAGLLPHGPEDALMDVQACAVVDAGGRVTWGHSGGFTLPADFTRRIREHGETVGTLFGELAADPDVGRKGGAIGHLTRGALDRTELTRHAVLTALVPRMNARLYGLDLVLPDAES